MNIKVAPDTHISKIRTKIPLAKPCNTGPLAPRCILLFIALSILLSTSISCRKKASVPVSSPKQPPISTPAEPAPQAITPTVIPASKPESIELSPAPKLVTAPTSFDMGMASFKAGDYVNASRFLEDSLKTSPKSENGDAVLFYLGLTRALSGNSNKNMRRADEFLKRLLVDYPTSPYKAPAEIILELQTQIENLQSDLKEKDAKIKQLSEELQKLKEIDMQRRPSRPPY